MSFSVLHQTPLGAIALDAKEHVLEVNPAFEALTHLPSATIHGRRFGEVLRPLSDAPDGYGELASGAREHAEIVRTVAEGPQSGKRLRITLWRDEPLTYGLVQALDAREEIAAGLTQIAALVSHEIRNPLAGIGSALEVIADRLPPDGVEREVIAEIHRRLGRLNLQLDDLMLLVRPVDLRRQRCEIDMLVAMACATAGVPPPAGDGRVTLFVDPKLTARALACLLRYGAGTPAPTIDWSTSGDRVSIRVSGGRLAAIRGTAADGWSLDSRQDGLELPVARRVAEAHQGRLQADLTEMGVRLRLELPLQSARGSDVEAQMG